MQTKMMLGKPIEKWLSNIILTKIMSQKLRRDSKK